MRNLFFQVFTIKMNTKCRICYCDGAIFPIFEKGFYKDEDIAANLKLCTGREILDINGFPSNICYQCYIKLNETISFIETFNKTCTILESLRVCLPKLSSNLEPTIEIVDANKNKKNIPKEAKSIYFSDSQELRVILKQKCNLKIKSEKRSDIKNKSKCKNLKTANSRKIDKKYVFIGDKKSLKPTHAEDNMKKIKQHVKREILVQTDNNNTATDHNSDIFTQTLPYFKTEQYKENIQLGPLTDFLFKHNPELTHTDNIGTEHKNDFVTETLTDFKTEQDKENIHLSPLTNTFVLKQNPELEHIKYGKRIKTLYRVPEDKEKTSGVLCEICGQIFKSKDKLRKHFLNNHAPIISCPKCNDVMRNPLSLKSHLERRHGDPNFPCPVCAKMFNTKKQANQHNRSVHEIVRKKRSYSCKICDKHYASAISMVIHKRSVHTGERPAVCSVCNSAFYHNLYLKEHMRLHTGEKPYKCPVCRKPFAQRGNMKSHIKYNHKISDLGEVTSMSIDKRYLKYMKP